MLDGEPTIVLETEIFCWAAWRLGVKYCLQLLYSRKLKSERRMTPHFFIVPAPLTTLLTLPLSFRGGRLPGDLMLAGGNNCCDEDSDFFKAPSFSGLQAGADWYCVIQPLCWPKLPNYNTLLQAAPTVAVIAGSGGRAPSALSRRQGRDPNLWSVIRGSELCEKNA